MKVEEKKAGTKPAEQKKKDVSPKKSAADDEDEDYGSFEELPLEDMDSDGKPSKKPSTANNEGGSL